MTARLIRNPLALAFLAIVLLVLIGSTFAVVPENEQALIVSFGKIERTVNVYRPGERLGETGAGLIARIPFAENIIWVDKRILAIDMDRQQALSTDQQRLLVDAFARYRIVDPAKMFITAGDEAGLGDRLKPILGSAIRNELGRRPFAALLSPERGEMMTNIRTALNHAAHEFGAEIIDVRIKRADLPDGTPLQSAFNRMRTAREQQARSIQAQGEKQAQIIRAEADAAAAKTYADAFGKDPQFYDFYRAMQSYRYTFVNNGTNQMGRTGIVLSPNNDYLREFTGRH